MVAMQLSHDPLVRQSVRTAFQERAKIRVQPTKKGMKVVFLSSSLYMHACFSCVKEGKLTKFCFSVNFLFTDSKSQIITKVIFYFTDQLKSRNWGYGKVLCKGIGSGSKIKINNYLVF